MLVLGLAFPGLGQISSGDIRSKIDTVIFQAYRSASGRFPCKLKSGGKARMLRWQQVAECLNDAYDRVDWDDISSQLQAIRKESGLPANEFLDLAETSLSAHALPYEKVFRVKEMHALLRDGQIRGKSGHVRGNLCIRENGGYFRHKEPADSVSIYRSEGSHAGFP
jgi:hypothetical protein